MLLGRFIIPPDRNNTMQDIIVSKDAVLVYINVRADITKDIPKIPTLSNRIVAMMGKFISNSLKTNILRIIEIIMIFIKLNKYHIKTLANII
jgi:hypothetical protein